MNGAGPSRGTPSRVRNERDSALVGRPGVTYEPRGYL